MNETDLQTEVTRLRRELDELRSKLNRDEMARRETVAMYRLFAVGALLLIIVQTVMVVLEKPSPFTGAFGWLLFGMASLYLVLHLIQQAMYLNHKMKLKAKISAKETEIETRVGKLETKESSG